MLNQAAGESDSSRHQGTRLVVVVVVVVIVVVVVVIVVVQEVEMC